MRYEDSLAHMRSFGLELHFIIVSILVRSLLLFVEVSACRISSSLVSEQITTGVFFIHAPANLRDVARMKAQVTRCSRNRAEFFEHPAMLVNALHLSSY